MRMAVFVGGPHDGQAMVLAEDRHPHILIPVMEPLLADAPKVGALMEDRYTVAHYAVARYTWAPIGGLPKSKVDIFKFDGMER